MKYSVMLEGRDIEVAVEPRPDGRFAVTFDGRTFVADLKTIGKGPLHALIVGARSCEVAAVRDRDAWRLDLRGASYAVRVETELEHAARAIDATATRRHPAEVRARMPGFVTRILVAKGDSVVKGTPLMIVEAMKMENEIRAECAGVVAEVSVKERQTVNNGDVLLRLS